MNLSERQRLMLREMGVRLWSAPSRAVAPPAAEGDAAGADSAAAGGVAAEPAPRRAHMRGAAAATLAGLAQHAVVGRAVHRCHRRPGTGGRRHGCRRNRSRPRRA